MKPESARELAEQAVASLDRLLRLAYRGLQGRRPRNVPDPEIEEAATFIRDALQRLLAEPEPPAPQPPDLYWSAALAEAPTRLEVVETTRAGEWLTISVRFDPIEEGDVQLAHEALVDLQRHPRVRRGA